MTQAEVIAKMQTVFDEVFIDQVELSPALSAKDVPEWDSLIHINLVLAVEQRFGVRFGVGEVEATRNVGDLADLIIKKMG